MPQSGPRAVRKYSDEFKLTAVVTFPTDSVLHRALRTYIRYYNQTRLHSSLDYLSPLAFERRAA
jgi:transposase InsO family protein